MGAAEVFAEWFAPPRRWRVVTEASGVREHPDGVVVYAQGSFVIDGAQFTTPFGTPAGAEGFLIREVGEDGQDLEDGDTVAFRPDVLLRAAKMYGTVAGLPVL